METIPNEIFLEILSYIGSSTEELLPYVTVSRRWQFAIEQRSFNHLWLKNTELSTCIFENLFRSAWQAHRKAFIKRLTIRVDLPTYDGEDCQQYKETNNQVFSTAVHKIFQILESFDEDEEIKNVDGLEFVFRLVTSPSYDITYENHPALFGMLIRLLDHEKLPTVSCVSRLCCLYAGSSRKFDQVPLVFAAGKLKDLKYCKIHYYNDRDYLAVDIKKPMPNVVSDYTHSPDELGIEFRESSPYDEGSAPTNSIPLSSPIDPLDVAFHNLIQDAFVSKATFTKEHVISPEFFWPYDSLEAVPAKLPFWPNLKDMVLICSPASPDGDWYFMGDPNTASHTEFINQDNSPASCGGGEQSQLTPYSGGSDNVFRSIPNPGKMNHLLIAMARAVRFAPSVRDMQLLFGSVVRLTPKFTKKTVDMKREFKVFYFASGFNHDFWTSPVEKNRLICQVGTWRMDEEVERHWKDALGPDGVIIYR